MPEEYVEMPIVGGRYHGEAVMVRRGASGLTMSELVEDNSDLIGLVFRDVRYYVFRVVHIMPGRTDRQAIPVLGRNGAMPFSKARDAVLKAWAAGWAPDDSTSEFDTTADVARVCVRIIP